MPRFYQHICSLALLCASAVNLNLCAGDAEFADTIRLYDAETSQVSRFYNLSWSKIRQDRLTALSKTWLQNLADADFDDLNQDGRIDYILLREQITYEIAKNARECRDLEEIAELIPFRDVIENLEVARWQKKPLNPGAAAKALSGLPEQIQDIRKRLEKGRKNKKEQTEEQKPAEENSALSVSPLLAFRAARTTDSIRRALKTWNDAYSGTQPDFSWWMETPVGESMKALEDYAKYLREELAHIKGKDDDPLLGEPLGADGLKRDLAVEFLPYNAQELLAIGEKEFAWCEARLLEAAKAMNFGDDWRAALAQVKANFVPPGQQGDFIVEQANLSTDFVKNLDLVTVPPLCEETWRISMTTTDTQRQMPYVAYNGMHILVGYARNDMSNEDKLMSMRGNNKHFTRITTAHELIPGHHLQGFFTSRYRDYRSLFRTPFNVEGWALYWEMVLWDKGFAQTPEDQIGMLFWRMHRAARIIVTLKFHLGEMTPQEMVTFLIDRVGHEKLGATSEVRRFIAGDFAPLYQCGYMIGGLQLRALAKAVTADGKMTEKQFNDAILRMGTIPIEMIRAKLLNVPLTRDTQSTWRFAD